MLIHSEGVDWMTKTEIEELGDLLSDTGAAPDSGVIGSYPKGYEDCNGYLRAGATSLDLAADIEWVAKTILRRLLAGLEDTICYIIDRRSY
jgi:hypothetical protein